MNTDGTDWTDIGRMAVGRYQVLIRSLLAPYQDGGRLKGKGDVLLDVWWPYGPGPKWASNRSFPEIVSYQGQGRRATEI